MKPQKVFKTLIAFIFITLAVPIAVVIGYFFITTIDLRSPAKRFGWEPYSSTKGNFTILMPQPPTEEKSGKTHRFISRDEHFTYFVSYKNYSQEYIDYYADYLLNEFQKELVSAGGTIVVNEDTKLDGYLGREFRVRESDRVHPNLIEGRVYKVDNRIYLIYIKYSLPWGLSDEIDAYLNSFEIQN